MPTKSIFVSRTFWLNVIGLAVLILSSADVLAILPPAAIRYEVAALAILNILNRFLTSMPVSLLGSRAEGE